jgi:ABC-type multidrug transport system fused ATPase/permease subunit
MTSLLLGIWSILTPRQRRWVLWAQALSILMAFSTVIGIASITPFFAVLGDPQSIDRSKILHWAYTAFGFADRRGFEIALGMAFIAVVFIANLINTAGSFVMIRLSWHISTDMKSALFREYLSRPYAFHTQTPSALLFNNIIYKTNVTTSMLQSIFILVTNTVTAAFIVLSVMLLNPALGSAIVVALAGGYLAIYLSMRNRLMRAGQVQSGFFTDQTKLVNESLAAIKEISVLHAQNFFRLKFEQASRAFAQAAAHTQLVSQTPKQVMECVAVVGLVLVALFGSAGDNGVGSWLGQLTFLGFAAYRLLPTLQQAFAALVGIRSNRGEFAIIEPDLRRARAGMPEYVPHSSWQQSPKREICLKEVSFCYQADRLPAISRVSARIPANAAVGFVGPNGSGKTTLMDVIAGLLAPDTGYVEIDGIALDSTNAGAWQSRIAYVPQSIFLLDATIAQNIAFGVGKSSIDRHRIVEAARLAQLDDFVSSLPDAYDHRLGERGVRLSGGQRQRIGIARALYTDASVLILDEATNALDGLTEHELMATLLRLRGRYTVLLIAHRLSTVRACDLIFELDQGQIKASGTYNELLKSSEAFRRLADIPR